MKINENYLLKDDYVFTKINKNVAQFKEKYPKKRILNLGIGDVTCAMNRKLIEVMANALYEQTNKKTFKGYPPETGYDFLKNAIVNKYALKGISFICDEIFISNGAGCDVTNILNLFHNLTAVIADPTYPAYLNSNKFYGNDIILLPLTKQNNYKLLPYGLMEDRSYLIYICSPNNPTGVTLNHNELKTWVDFANKTQSIILFDNAYESFVEDNSPKSIYEVEGAKTCAIEVSSFSKSAGFTNLRCGFTIVPKELMRQNNSINNMWLKHQCTFFNGVPYHIQKGSLFVLSSEGEKICQKNIKYYKTNVQILEKYLKYNNFEFVSSNNSPYIWVKIPTTQTSWQYFNFLLNTYGIVCVPGSGFGKCGEGYIRFSAFATREEINLAMKKLTKSAQYEIV